MERAQFFEPEQSSSFKNTSPKKLKELGLISLVSLTIELKLDLYIVSLRCLLGEP